MKAALALLSLVGLVAAQDFSSVPPCALGCLYKAIPDTGCSMTDVDCLCRKEKQAQLQAAAGDCLNSQCSASDLTKAENLSKEICKQLTSSGAPATVTVTAGGSSSSSGSGSQSGSTTTTSSAAGTTASTNSTSSTWSNSTTVTSASKTTSLETTATTTTTTTTPSATRSPNAAAGTAAGALVAVVALAFAL